MFGWCRRCHYVEPEVLAEGVRRGEAFVGWGEAVRVTAWTQDLFTTDRHCITIESPHGEVSVSEEDSIWEELLVALRREWRINVDDYPDLWSHPFSTETVVLMSREDKLEE